MITYKIENSAQAAINGEIREMATQLASIAPTLQKLQSIINRHESTISSPSLTEFRADLQKMVNDAAVLSKKISENSQTLVEVSEQTAQHLASIEAHYGSLLKTHLSEK